MSIINLIKDRIKYEKKKSVYKSSKRKNDMYNVELTLADVKYRFPLRNDEYMYFHHYFWNLIPEWAREHRQYFSQERRGFGEDAFHAMWYFLFREFKPKSVLEIGIYRGQSLSFFALLSQKFNLNSEIHGISPFTSAGDGVSNYLQGLDYYEDVKEHFRHFHLPEPSLHKGLSTDPEMVQMIQSQKWDLVYIDGNHDYEVAKADFDLCAQNLSSHGIIVMDDASLNTKYKPYLFSTAGHPGPSKVASEIDHSLFEEILSVGHNRVYKKK